MTTAHITAKGDSSVGIDDQHYIVECLEFQDADHREECRTALRATFALIVGEFERDVTVIFEDEFLQISLIETELEAQAQLMYAELYLEFEVV